MIKFIKTLSLLTFMTILPPITESTFLTIARHRYTSNILISTDLIRKISGKEFESIADLEKSLDELLENDEFAEQFIDTKISEEQIETPFNNGLSSEKKKFITYMITGKKSFQHNKQTIGFNCEYENKIIGGTPILSETIKEHGDEYFKVSCSKCNETLNKHFGYRHTI